MERMTRFYRRARTLASLQCCVTIQKHVAHQHALHEDSNLNDFWYSKISTFHNKQSGVRYYNELKAFELRISFRRAQANKPCTLKEIYESRDTSQAFLLDVSPSNFVVKRWTKKAGFYNPSLSKTLLYALLFSLPHHVHHNYQHRIFQMPMKGVRS